MLDKFEQTLQELEQKGYVEDFPPSENKWHYTKYVPGKGMILADVCWDIRRIEFFRIHNGKEST